MSSHEESEAKELERLKARVAELESSEAASDAAPKSANEEAKEQFVSAKDQNSVHVSNLDSSVGPEDLQQVFGTCGVINRITILVNKLTGESRGFGYVEFEKPETVEIALGLDESELKGKAIKVMRKRTNVPRFMLRGGRGRGRGRGGFRGRGRGRGRGGFRGRGGRGGGRGGFHR